MEQLMTMSAVETIRSPPTGAKRLAR